MKKIRKKRKKNILIKKNKPKKLFKISLKFKIKFYFFIFLLLCFLAFALFIYQFETKVVPTAIVIGEKYATNIVEQEIDKSVEKTILEMGLYSEKFFNKSLNQTTNHYLDVNAILINNVCLNVSTNLTQSLKEMNETKIELPIGIFSGFNAFSGIGPKFKISIVSIGDATVDYETNFVSVGINQINFQVYLKINTQVSIINPMYKKDILISRKLMLVNTVFNGEVPNTYLNLPNEKIYK